MVQTCDNQVRVHTKQTRHIGDVKNCLKYSEQQVPLILTNEQMYNNPVKSVLVRS